MGMFDYVVYKGEKYQSKDTDRQSCDTYRIVEDQESGHEYLWLDEYDTEWVDDPEAMFGGWFKEINHRWVRQDKFDGKIFFYRNIDQTYKLY